MAQVGLWNRRQVMPYIDKFARDFLQQHIWDLQEIIKEVDGGSQASAGTANYVISSIIADVMKPTTGWTYSSLSRALAVFRDAEAEMRRRLLDPYEDKAIERNGDIPEYEK